MIIAKPQYLLGMRVSPSDAIAENELINWVVVSNIFYFQPFLGTIPILTNIFQMG